MKEEVSQTEIVQKSTLSNGLRVITETIPSVRSISAGIWVKIGSRWEKEPEAGITHFLEHMLFKGTDTRTSFDISSSIEATGGYLNAMTSSEYTCYYVRCLDSELETAIDVLTDMVLHPKFPDEEIEKEKKVVIEEMKMYRDNPDDFIFEEFIGQLYEQHALGRPIIGYENTVSGFKRNDLFQFVNDHYTPDNLVVAVAGNASHEEVLELLEKYYQRSVPTTRNDSNGVKKDVLTPYRPSQKTLARPIEQTHYIIGKRGLSSSDPERYKLLLIQTILSGGMSSRLHQNIREKYGYCYSISAFLQSYLDTGVFGVYIGTDKDYLTHVKELIFKEFTKLKEERVDENELGQAKSQLKGKLLLSQESMSSRMNRLAKSEIYFDRFITLDELVESIDAVSAEDIRNYATEFFNEDEFSETVLLPEQKEDEKEDS
ncbi:MAG TPA: pitrilysin family protein [Balneolales bacterium]|nr:pitrilysin family protein [Balneolales bacterium]